MRGISGNGGNTGAGGAKVLVERTSSRVRRPMTFMLFYSTFPDETNMNEKHPWTLDCRATALPKELSAAFDKHLNGLPWLGVSLDWSRMPRSVRIDAREPGLAWRQSTRIGKHDLIAVWYSVEQGGIVVPFEVGIPKLDELYWQTPGTRFVFGVRALDGELSADFDAILQYGSGDEWIATAIVS